MNDRIKELAVLSGVVEAHVNWDAAGGNFLEKFAELIIQDCIKSVEELHIPKNDFRSSTDYGYSQWWEGYDDRGSDSIDTIKKYFGINN